LSRSRATDRSEGTWRRFLPLFTRCGGDNGGSCLRCARSRPHTAHRDLLTSPAPHGVVPWVPPLPVSVPRWSAAFPLPLRHCSATSPRRSAGMASQRCVGARGQRRSVDRVHGTPHLHLRRRGRRLPLPVFTAAGSRSSALRTPRWCPTSTDNLPGPVCARAPRRRLGGRASSRRRGFDATRRSAPAIP
jgi:hypothetical protein